MGQVNLALFTHVFFHQMSISVSYVSTRLSNSEIRLNNEPILSIINN